MSKEKNTSEKTEKKGPSKKQQFLAFLSELGGDEAHASTVELIMAKLKEIRYIGSPKAKLEDLLTVHQIGWAKMTFIAEAAEMDGVSEEVVTVLAEAAAKKEIEDPATTKLYRIARVVGAEVIADLYKIWVTAQYAALAEAKGE